MKIVGKHKLEDQEVYDIGLRHDHNFILENGSVASNCFNKAHSLAYSILSFRTAYLKCHYPAYFYAAELTSWDGEVDKLLPSIADARKHNISLLPPDINQSTAEFTPTDNFTVRFGLAGIKGLGYAAVEDILSSRGDKPFDSIYDFVTRTNSRYTKKNNLSALAYSGAFSTLEPDMNPLELEDYVLSWAAAVSKDSKIKDTGQISLFDIIDFDYKDTYNIPKSIISCPLETLYELEKESLGLCISYSPLDKYRDLLSKVSYDEIASLEVEDINVTLIGHIESCSIRSGKNGDYAFLKLSDDTGSIECKVWSNVLSKCLDLVKQGNVVLIRGKTTYYRGIEVVVNSMTLAEVESNRLLDSVTLSKLTFEIIDILYKKSRGTVPVYLKTGNRFTYKLGSFNLTSEDVGILNELE